MKALAGAIVMLLVLTACESAREFNSETTTSTTAAETIRPPISAEPAQPTGPAGIVGGGAAGTGPPAVIVRADGVELALQAWTTCWRTGCYDGRPPPEPMHIGAPLEIEVEFPVQGWEFTATATVPGAGCGRRSQSETLTPLGPTTHLLSPIGLAGDYNITLFGRGPGGDLLVSFRWTTPVDGVLPTPQARASILADHDGFIDSYGIEVPLWNLASTPDSVEGQALVVSAEGMSHSFNLSVVPDECDQGMIFLTAPLFEGLAVAALGSAPFRYEITLRLDDVVYTGRATWPADVDPECEPCVRLEFDPPLPALEAGT